MNKLEWLKYEWISKTWRQIKYKFFLKYYKKNLSLINSKNNNSNNDINNKIINHQSLYLKIYFKEKRRNFRWWGLKYNLEKNNSKTFLRFLFNKKILLLC